jgi:hypothetical protein
MKLLLILIFVLIKVKVLILLCRWSIMDTDKIRLNHGNKFQIIIQCKRLLENDRLIPKKILSNRPSSKWYSFLFRIPCSRSHYKQLTLIPCLDIKNPLKLTSWTFSINPTHKKIIFTTFIFSIKKIRILRKSRYR